MPSGVRAALDNAANRGIESRTFEAAYLTTMVATSAVAVVLLWVGRRLSH